ncbi:SDR family oxidoreductase [Alteromonas sp. C1M14]|uniref:SDR family oxidoreductase n=1 Tax=Alteromonas sp. C1M14 TaxID=2841567 RepID=UPI001C08865D|nr:SDR family oxidoreductase [Alteromonas sp. C1M14]MBU2977387.1 SDR family oxidoreductase [Alteromonas sp. C1M14]
MAINWENQVVLLTGASGGIGSAMAKAIDKKGGQLVLTGRDEAKLQQLSALLNHSHKVIQADITTPCGRKKISHVCERLPISILINNAGITQVGEFSEAAIPKIINTNLTAPMLLTQEMMPQLCAQPQAHVVNVGSALGGIGFAAHSVYCATKFGIKGWTEAMIREHANTQLHFHYLAPRATNTAINDSRVNAMNKALKNTVDSPETVADALITLLTNNVSRRELGLSERFFTKLNALFPSLVDKALAKQLDTIKKYTFSHAKSVQPHPVEEHTNGHLAGEQKKGTS